MVGAVPRKEAKQGEPASEPKSPVAEQGGGSTAQRIRDEAARQFWRRGYAATSTRELAESIDIQKASLFHHIGSKEQLLYELCVESVERMQAGVRDALKDLTDPRERIRVLIGTHLTFLLDDRDKHAVMLVETRSLSERYRRHVLALQAEYEGTVRDVVAEAQDAGMLRSDLSPGILSLALFDLLNWSIFWYEPGRGLSREDLAETFGTLFLEGAEARGEPRPPK